MKLSFKTLLASCSVITLSLAAAINAVALPTPTANATGPCGAGYTLVDHYAVPSLGVVAGYGAKGTTVAYIDLYWSGTAHRNCAVANAAGPSYGKTLLRSIEIGGDSFRSCGSGFCNPDDYDQGNYAYYAGPVYTRVQTGPYCVTLLTDMRANTSSPYIGQRLVQHVHC